MNCDWGNDPFGSSLFAYASSIPGYVQTVHLVHSASATFRPRSQLCLGSLIRQGRPRTGVLWTNSSAVSLASKDESRPFMISTRITSNLAKHISTWNPNDRCFYWNRPCLGGLKPKNRAQRGSRHIYIYIHINICIYTKHSMHGVIPWMIPLGYLKCVDIQW